MVGATTTVTGEEGDAVTGEAVEMAAGITVVPQPAKTQRGTRAARWTIRRVQKANIKDSKRELSPVNH